MGDFCCVQYLGHSEEMAYLYDKISRIRLSYCMVYERCTKTIADGIIHSEISLGLFIFHYIQYTRIRIVHET